MQEGWAPVIIFVWRAFFACMFCCGLLYYNHNKAMHNAKQNKRRPR